jgi:hypothetical protein
MNQLEERQKAILEQLFFYAALICLVVGTVGFVLLDHYSVDLKEKCLHEGGTAVEYPKGTFERCIKK